MRDLINTMGEIGFDVRTMDDGDEAPVKICSICQRPYEGHGNNAYPVNGGRCCDVCNMGVVVPARLNLLR
jgi:hypothetical protein